MSILKFRTIYILILTLIHTRMSYFFMEVKFWNNLNVSTNNSIVRIYVFSSRQCRYKKFNLQIF